MVSASGEVGLALGEGVTVANRIVSLAIICSLAILHAACSTPPHPLSVPPGSTPIAAQQNLKGSVYYQMGHWSAAKDHFVSAIEADPNLAESHFNLALALDKLDRHSEATTHFRRAAELAPDNKILTRAQSSAYNHVVTLPFIHETDPYGTDRYGRADGVYPW